jgi:hypothetical protein
VNAQTRATADLMVLMMAVLSGIAVSILSLLLSQGWRAALCSATAIVLAPAAAIVWCYRDRRGMPRFARWVTAANVVIDVAMVVATHRTEVTAAFDNAPPAFVIWGSLWVLWQVLGASAIRQS